jgi:hypothetical protein
MTRYEATEAIYKLISCGILDKELEDTLTEVCNSICYDDFEKCKQNPKGKHGFPNYCKYCEFLEEN